MNMLYYPLFPRKDSIILKSTSLTYYTKENVPCLDEEFLIHFLKLAYYMIYLAILLLMGI